MEEGGTMPDLTSNTAVAANIAAGLTNVDTSRATVLPGLAETNITGTLLGVDLGNRMIQAVRDLDSLIIDKAKNINQIAEAFVEADKSLAASLS